MMEAARLVVLIGLMLLCGCDQQSQDQPAGGSRTTQHLDEDKVQASLAAAEEYLNAQDLDKAEAIITTLIRRDSEECRAHEMLGQIMLARTFAAHEQGEANQGARFLQRAHEAYEAAAECEPDSAGLHQSAGEIAQLAGNVDAALEHYEAASRLDPANCRHPLYAAQIHLQRSNLPAAEAALERVLALCPDEPIGLASVALLRMEQDRYDEAIEYIREARRADADDLNIRIQEAKIYRRADRPELAVELLAGLSEPQRATPAVAWELASSYTALEQPGKAAAIWVDQFNRSPDAPDAWPLALKAAESFLEAGDLSAARQWLLTAQRLAPGAPDVASFAQRLSQAAAGSRSNEP